MHEVLTAIPGGAALIFDHALRVRVAEGHGFALAGYPAEKLVGQRLPEVLPPQAWERLKGPYEGALSGRTERFEFASLDRLFHLQVRPVDLPGELRGALAVSREITEQRRLESAVLEQEQAARSADELLRSAFDHAPIGISVTDLKGHWLQVNDAYCAMLGYRRDELMGGSSFRDLRHPEDVGEGQAFLEAALAGERDSLESEVRYLHKDGSIVWVHLRSELIRDGGGAPAYVVSHLQDIGDQRATRQLLSDSERTLRSIIDNTPAMVSVKGRDSRYRLVNREFERVFNVSGEWLMGRGDEALMPQEAVDIVQAKDHEVLTGGLAVQEEETLTRDGQERVLLTMRFPLRDEQQETQAVCSVSTDITERRLEELAKRERLQCSDMILTALAEERFVLYGQPIIDLNTMETTQAELLIRMHEKGDGGALMPPAAFLPPAERFGLIQVIDEWVVERALVLAGRGHCVEVNLSAKTISDAGRVDRIAEQVVTSGVPPQHLIFEITETAVAGNLDAARDFAQRLRQLGCAFALDDFGVGHGTFTYLKHLHVDYLKIDQSFVRDLLSDDSDRHVVQAIIGVARQFGIETIAEGVEDEATLDVLQLMGVDHAQGYFIGRPMPLAQLWKSNESESGGTDVRKSR